MAEATSPTLRELYARELALHGYQSDPAQLAALAPLESLRARLLTQRGGRLAWLARRWRPGGAPGPRGVYLWGAVGRGKTWLMDLFYDSLPGRARRRLHFHHFMRDVHQALKQTQGERAPLERVARRVATEVRVLCLDELFVSDIADAMILSELFEALLTLGTALVITANVPPRELYRGGLQRSRFLPAIALLERELEIVGIDGPTDYRLRHLQQQLIYLDSAAADVNTQLHRILQQLAGDHGESGTELQLQGRRIRALQRRGEVIWFSFGVLCEGPRSQNDYADIAQEFHTVLLSDVPVFSQPQQDNAARRFIALVDELYDQGVKLVLSAAAPPAELYQGEALQFEFHRTSSRLIEMQSEAYLARPHRQSTALLSPSAAIFP